jgi:hypothetical protein
MKLRPNNVIIIFCLTSIIACLNKNNKIEYDTKLSDEIYSILNTTTTDEVSFNSITSFKWDKVCIFPPYISTKTIISSIGFEWEMVNEINIKRDDTTCLIVFSIGDQIVSYFLHPRNKGDFSYLKEYCYKPEEAIYHVELKIEDNKEWYIMRKD